LDGLRHAVVFLGKNRRRLSLNLADVFTWIDHLWLGEAIRDSSWLFAFIEVFHLLGLTLLLGSTILVNLRMLGFGSTRSTLADVADDAMTWMIVGLVVTIPSGICLFISEALKCYENPPFFIKMGLLALALLFTFTLHRRITRSGEGRISPLWRTLGACTSLALWFGVGLAGRAIAFY
jgi:hypothetical protein